MFCPEKHILFLHIKTVGFLQVSSIKKICESLRMALNFFKKSQKFKIGLDITPEGITAISLNRKDKKLFLKDCVFESFKEETIQNGLIISPKTFTETLKKLLDEHEFETETANIAIPSSVAFIKTLTLPEVPQNELGLIITQEASKHIPFPLDEVNFDYEVLENTKRQESSCKKVDIVLVALTKAIAKSYINPVYDAGLIVSSIDLAPFSMIRTLAKAGSIDDSDFIYVSVLIGHENTDINIVHKGVPLFSHNTPVGKKNIIEALVTSLEADEQEVEKLLPEIALVVAGQDINQDHQLSKAAGTARTIYNNISNEIQKTVEFYNSRYASPKEVKKIIIGGSGVCIQNIDKYLANRLKTDTELCNSLKNIEHNLDISENLVCPVNIPALAACIGLALKGSDS